MTSMPRPGSELSTAVGADPYTQPTHCRVDASAMIEQRSCRYCYPDALAQSLHERAANMNTTVFETITVAQPVTISVPSQATASGELQTIDLGQLLYVDGGGNGFWSDLGYNALNLGKASVNGLVNTANWLLPKTVDVNLGIVKAHFEPSPIGKPFRDDPRAKIGHPPDRQLAAGH
jgi:hypothetical protein